MTGQARKVGLQFAIGLAVTIAIAVPAIGTLTPSQGLAQLPPANVIPLVFENPNAWRQVYEQVPDLPLENQYISIETGEVDENSTLISRLIRYHLYTKGRPPFYRLDWKLTLADYMAANEIMNLALYPGVDTLRTNPMRNDMAAISSLTRAQRAALVDALVLTFYPEYAAAVEANAPIALPIEESDSQEAAPPRILAPQPGDAQLLMP